MANGRALPSALLFDWLLGRAWSLGLNSYAQANGIAMPAIDDNMAKVDGAYSIKRFASSFSGGGVASAVARHDRSLEAQLEEVALMWATEFQGVMQLIAPVGPGFHTAVRWLRDVTNGHDGLGYVGRDHRIAQAQGQAALALATVNARGLPVPTGANAALLQVASDITNLYGTRLVAQLDADREAERKKLLIDAVETLSKLRNEALDAAMDFVFAQMNMMFDVFGRNNNYLTNIQREEQAMQARMQVLSAELTAWDQGLMQVHDGSQDAQRKAKALNDRNIEKKQLMVDQHIKRLRRYSSRAAAALNSAGVSVTSTAAESNSIDAEQS